MPHHGFPAKALAGSFRGCALRTDTKCGQFFLAIAMQPILVFTAVTRNNKT
jgi:hypothetical protein